MNLSKRDTKIRTWLTSPLPREVNNAIKRLSASEGVRHMAIMPDVHLSGDVCIGTVLATDSQIYPQAVGNDIGCGMATMRFDCQASDLLNENNAAKTLSALGKLIPSNRHSSSSVNDQLPLRLLQQNLSHKTLEKEKSRDGLVQFGTLGRGNHFLEFQADDKDILWVTVHSGSRGIGQKIVNHHLGQPGVKKDGPLFLEADSSSGQAYLNDQQWACTYARLSRIKMIDRVQELLKQLFGISALESSFFSCDHNHVRRESHFGGNLYVHRKGSLSAFKGELGIIPGSMGSATFHTKGRGHENSLCSSSHGAGRVMSRGEARKKISANNLHNQMEGIWFDHRKSRSLVDEAPSAYKNIESVMRAQKDLTRIVRKLKPILSYKGA